MEEELNKLSESIIGTAMEIHRALGPSLLENTSHKAQRLTYLKLSKKPLGLFINFHVPLLRDGIRRLINKPL